MFVTATAAAFSGKPVVLSLYLCVCVCMHPTDLEIVVSGKKRINTRKYWKMVDGAAFWMSTLSLFLLMGLLLPADTYGTAYSDLVVIQCTIQVRLYVCCLNLKYSKVTCG